MKRVNIEIKARLSNADAVRKILQEQHADYKGVDNQTDTYFTVPSGKLKLREGTIENALIFYRREYVRGPKRSDVLLCPISPDTSIKAVLQNALGVLVTVKKKREIYYLDNVKFHVDDVQGLGSFVEIEAMKTGEQSEEELMKQCQEYMQLFGITEQDLVAQSYSDLIMEIT